MRKEIPWNYNNNCTARESQIYLEKKTVVIALNTMTEFGTLTLKWDPKHLEIRTMSVEKTLEPLVLQVTTLVNTKGPSKKKKGK